MTAVTYSEPSVVAELESEESLDEAIAYLDDQARFAGEIWLLRFPSGRDW